MDSLTQFALGAAVGGLTLGPRIGARTAALIGGGLGTLPDLDVFYPFADPVDAFVLHRAATHSLLVHAAVAPVLAWGLGRLVSGLRPAPRHTTLAVFAILASHAGLDALTIYGTRLFWPVWPAPLGTGSVFVIDPLYTLPLLVPVVWALSVRAWTARLRRTTAGVLAATTAYLAWGLVAQHHVLAAAAERFAAAGLRPQRTVALAAPFTTGLWRVIGLAGDRYVQVYLSPLAATAPAPVYVYRRHAGRLGCLAENPAAATLARFANGFWAVEPEADALVIADLRMGLPPNHVFRFAVAGPDGRPIPPQRRRRERSEDGDLAWLLAGLTGDVQVRPAERLHVATTVPPATSTAAPAC